MKKYPLIIVICFLGFSSFAQDTTKATIYLNEFGIDVTGFLKQYLNFNYYQSNTYIPPYVPTYYLTYRRHFNSGNLRIQVGGDFINNQLPSLQSNDTNLYFDKGYSLYASVGWEVYNNLGKRWQVFYGADIRTSFIYSNTDYNTSGIRTANGSIYYNDNISETQVYGLAPFVGIRFKLTKRLSILTETSYSFNLENDFNRTSYIASPGATPPVPETTSQKYSKSYNTLSQPLSVFLDFTI